MFPSLKKNKEIVILAAILIFAAILRFSFLTNYDAYTDEVLIGFRAINMTDFLFSTYQTTPWEWVGAPIPWWMSLSFHDHPILVFFIEHMSIVAFGANLFALRIPAVIAGVLSVWLLYAISKELFNRRTAVLAALLMSIESYHIFISRIGLQDGFVLFFILLAIYTTMWAVKNKTVYSWILVGIVLGLGIITKYTGAIAIPIVFCYLYFFDRKTLTSKSILYLIGALIAVSAPSWLYNIILYKTYGHFDFQISQFLGQNVDKWQIRIGRHQSGNIQNRIIAFFGSMRIATSVVFSTLTILSFISGLVWFVAEKKRSEKFIFVATIFIWLWFLIVGAAPRFVVIVVPFFILLIACCADKLLDISRIRAVVWLLCCLVIIFEFVFTLNTFYFPRRISASPKMFAFISMETQNFGFSELDDYIRKETKDNFPVVFDAPPQKFFESIRNTHIEKQKQRGATERPLIIIYDKKMNMLASLWTLYKYYFYEGWAVLSDERFAYASNNTFDEYFRGKGANEFLYITGFEPVSQKKYSVFPFSQEFLPHSREVNTNSLIEYLKNKGIAPSVIPNKYGDPTFVVYRF